MDKMESPEQSERVLKRKIYKKNSGRNGHLHGLQTHK